MKKIIPLLLACAFLTGCGKNQTSKTDKIEIDASNSSTSSSSSEKEQVVIDPLSSVSIEVIKEDELGETFTYPSDFKIALNFAQTDIADILSPKDFDMEITKATIDEIFVKVSIEEEVISELENQNYKLSETENEFVVHVADTSAKLISKEQLSQSNKEMLIEAANKYIEEKIKKENDDAQNWNDTFSDLAANNSENGMEQSDLTSTSLSLVKCYMTDIASDIDFATVDSSTQECAYDVISEKLECILRTDLNCELDMIFKNNNEQYFYAQCYPKFHNGVVSTDSLQFYSTSYLDTNGFSLSYPSEEDVNAEIFKENASSFIEID